MSRPPTIENKIRDAIDGLADQKALEKKVSWENFAWLIDDLEFVFRAATYDTAMLKYCIMERAKFRVDEPRTFKIRGKNAHRKVRTYECTLLESQRFKIVRV